MTWGTTEAFLVHFGLNRIDDLPGLDELKGSGLLDGQLPPGFGVPSPSDDPGLREDEDPLGEDLFTALAEETANAVIMAARAHWFGDEGGEAAEAAAEDDDANPA